MRTKTVRRLGNETFIKENYGVGDAETWAREELDRMRQACREEKQGVVVELHPDRLINGTERVFNGGVIFVEQVLSRLGLRDICKKISVSHRIKFDLGDYLTRMVCSRILHPGSKMSDFINGSRFIERKDLRLERRLSQIRALEGKPSQPDRTDRNVHGHGRSAAGNVCQSRQHLAD